MPCLHCASMACGTLLARKLGSVVIDALDCWTGFAGAANLAYRSWKAVAAGGFASACIGLFRRGARSAKTGPDDAYKAPAAFTESRSIRFVMPHKCIMSSLERDPGPRTDKAVRSVRPSNRINRGWLHIHARRRPVCGLRRPIIDWRRHVV